MPHSFPSGETPADVMWGGPPGPAISVHVGAGETEEGGQGVGQRTWASAPPLVHLVEIGKLCGIELKHAQR